MATLLVKHGVVGRLAAWKDQEGNLHSYFIPSGAETAWLWTDTTGVMVDEAANDPS